ncbi:MAG: bifunctional diaminohydroxyphosphoribosylaminopyrimidine deaminase/5-amino-6-(5-phosphoribosylamino)uracil reductase RibD [Ferruginibacter sp.]
MNIHEFYMRRCFQLAELGKGNVSPNPMVGAVLVYNNRIIGEGYHAIYGGEHAEVACINNVTINDKIFIEHSVLYVSLEPCSHFGKTPPCSDLIIKSKIKKVVIAMTDPFKDVSGSGIKKLREAGIEVIENVLNVQAEEINRRFLCFHLKRRPYIILKWAKTADNFIGSGTKQRLIISNKYSNFLVQLWRGEEDAIMVGTNTALLDNPKLNNRSGIGKNPLRIAIDKTLRIPENYFLLDNSQSTIIINEVKCEITGNTKFIQIKKDQEFINSIFDYLYSINISSIIIEGGYNLLSSIINKGIWDEARIITNTNLLCGSGIPSPLIKGCVYKTEFIETDKIEFIRNKA